MEKLIKKLRLIEYASTSDWNKVSSVVELIKSDKYELIDKTWHDRFKTQHPDLYPFDLKDDKLFVTYEKCRTATFSLHKDKLCVLLEIWEGDNMTGYKKEKRCTITILIDIDFIKTIEKNINWKFDDFCVEQYDNHLAEQKRMWINSYKLDVLQ